LEECTGAEEDDGLGGRGSRLKNICFASVLDPVVEYGVWIEVEILDWSFWENEYEYQN